MIKVTFWIKEIAAKRRWGRRDCEAVTRYPTSQRAQNLALR